MPELETTPPSPQNNSDNPEIIQDVKTTTWSLIRKKYLSASIGVILLSILIIIIHPFLPIIALAVYYFYIQNKVLAEFMKQFAAANNLEYQKNLPLSSIRGDFFKIGHSQGISNALSGIYQNHPTKLFSYRFTTGGGKNQSVHLFTIFEVTFEKTIFPRILLQSQTMRRFGEFTFGSKEKEISLEENFKPSYRLFADPGYEVETLQIFTPEVLEFLKTQAPDFTVEFAEDRMYLYDDRQISNRAQLSEFYLVAKKMLDTLGPLLNRLHDDFAALHPYYKNKK